jgi:hypothetical protein
VKNKNKTKINKANLQKIKFLIKKKNNHKFNLNLLKAVTYLKNQKQTSKNSNK